MGIIERIHYAPDRSKKNDGDLLAADYDSLTKEEREKRFDLIFSKFHSNLEEWKEKKKGETSGKGREETAKESLEALAKPAAKPKPKKEPKREFETNIRDVTAPKAERVPFYHQTDSRGNSMAGLEAMRNEAKGRKAKLQVRVAIYAWSAEFDSQQKDENRRARDGAPTASSGIDQWKAEKKKQQAEKPQTKAEALKAQLAAAARDQIEKPEPAKEPTKAPPEPTAKQNKMDAVQLGMDAAGVADPTPIVDGVNAGVSLYRAYKEPERRKEHLKNAAISAVSMVPYIGDTAKLLKTGRAAKTVQRTAKAAKSPAAKAAERDKYRDGAKRLTDAVIGKDGGGGGDGGGNVPPSTPGGDDGGQRGGGRNKFIDAVESGAGKVSAFADKLAKAAGPIGKVAMGTAKTAVKVAALVKGLEMLNTGVIAMNRSLAAYSGGMAGAYAINDMRNMKRDMRKAESLDGPMQELIEQQAEFKDSMDRVVVPIQGIIINLEAKVTQVVNATLALVAAVPGVQEALDKLNEDTDPQNQTAIQDFFRDVSDGRFDGEAPRFASDKKAGQDK